MNQVWETAYLIAYCIHRSATEAAVIAKEAIDSMEAQKEIAVAERRRIAEERVLQCKERATHEYLQFTIERCKGGCGLTGKETYTDESWCRGSGRIAT